MGTIFYNMVQNINHTEMFDIAVKVIIRLNNVAYQKSVLNRNKYAYDYVNV